MPTDPNNIHELDEWLAGLLKPTDIVALARWQRRNPVPLKTLMTQAAAADWPPLLWLVAKSQRFTDAPPLTPAVLRFTEFAINALQNQRKAKK